MEKFDFIYEKSTIVNSSDLNWGKQYVCPNCGESFDGHHCEECNYTEMFY